MAADPRNRLRKLDPMEPLFSHAPDPVEEPGWTEAPVETEVLHCDLPRDLVECASGFVEYLNLWWPAELLPESAEGAALEGSDIIAMTSDGHTLLWGSVSAEQTGDAANPGLLFCISPAGEDEARSARQSREGLGLVLSLSESPAAGDSDTPSDTTRLHAVLRTGGGPNAALSPDAAQRIAASYAGFMGSAVQG
ncbi:hypothetical protein H9I38_03375 [Arthrobacter sp. UM1]|nr:hypothetical protein [Arthrobacter sp. UM1]